MKKSMGAMDASAKDVDTYLAAQPDEVRVVLEKLRKTIKSVAPNATEGMSYGMPSYKYLGTLVHFAAAKNHCALYGVGKALTAAHKDELKPYLASDTTLRFTVEKPLPAALVKKLVKARVAENEARAQAKRAKA
jgi:uncharacterized protein YdhG (YjbR/CyaY superfamily)